MTTQLVRESTARATFRGQARLSTWHTAVPRNSLTTTRRRRPGRPRSPTKRDPTLGGARFLRHSNTAQCGPAQGPVPPPPCSTWRRPRPRLAYQDCARASAFSDSISNHLRPSLDGAKLRWLDPSYDAALGRLSARVAPALRTCALAVPRRSPSPRSPVPEGWPERAISRGRVDQPSEADASSLRRPKWARTTLRCYHYGLFSTTIGTDSTIGVSRAPTVRERDTMDGSS
jgi:hypothetical protein